MGKILIKFVGGVSALISFTGIYNIFEGYVEPEYFYSTIGLSIFCAGLSFIIFSPWERVNYFIGSILAFNVGIFSFLSLFNSKYDDYYVSAIWASVFNITGVVLLPKAFNTTISEVFKNFIEWKPVNYLIVLPLVYAFWIGLFILALWLVISIGPLWIIAITLILILFVLANKDLNSKTKY